MARIRSTHPGQWADGDFLECSAFARLLVLALRNMADDNGVFRWKPKSIKATCLPADNCDIDGLLSELIKNEQITKFEVDGKTYGAVHNFCKYQKPRKPVAVHPMPDSVAAYVGKTTEVSDAEDGTDATSTDDSSAKVRTQPPSSADSSAKDGPGTELSIQREEGGGNRKDSSTEESKRSGARKPYPEDFENGLWKPYPNTAGMSKAEALKAWKDLTPDERLQAADRLPAFIKWMEGQGKDYRTLHACRYLSKKRFESLEPVAASVITGVPIYPNSPQARAWLKHYEPLKATDRQISIKWSLLNQDRVIREETEYPPDYTHTEAAE